MLRARRLVCVPALALALALHVVTIATCAQPQIPALPCQDASTPPVPLLPAGVVDVVQRYTVMRRAYVPTISFHSSPFSPHAHAALLRADTRVVADPCLCKPPCLLLHCRSSLPCAVYRGTILQHCDVCLTRVRCTMGLCVLPWLQVRR